MSAWANRIDAMHDRKVKVEAICMVKDNKRGYIVMDGGMKLPITTFIDCNGDNTKDPEEAWYIVAGRPRFGYITFDLASFYMPSYEDH